MPGDSVIYSDWDLVLALEALIIERITGVSTHDQFLATAVWEPLGMHAHELQSAGVSGDSGGRSCSASFAPIIRCSVASPRPRQDTVYAHSRPRNRPE